MTVPFCSLIYKSLIVDYLMKIGECLGTTKEEVESKKFNIWIGISLGNKYFTKENIEKYILWALEHTKEDVLIVIADRLYAIKLEFLDNYNKLRAFRVASRYGDDKEREINEILTKIPKEKMKLVKVARFKDIINTKYYECRLELLEEYYKKNKEFHDYIVEIVKEIYGTKKTLSDERIDSLAGYALKEIPIFLNGPYYGESKKEQKYYD